jgi:hydrogenase small subunit
VSVIEQVRNAGNYILAVEGGIPTKFNGGACYAWTTQGAEVTFADAVRDLASRAAAVLCIGTCSAFGGIPAAPPNPTGVVSVKALTGRTTINIAGCPPHPDWMVWAIVKILQRKTIALDSAGRPSALYGRRLHEQCPRKELDVAKSFGVPNLCLKYLGCRGPVTDANCPAHQWNNKVNWCVGANGPCLGCTNPDFPTARPFFGGEYSN